MERAPDPPVSSEPSLQKCGLLKVRVVREIPRWTCDVCGRPFLTYQEACIHEETCKVLQAEKQASECASTAGPSRPSLPTVQQLLSESSRPSVAATADRASKSKASRTPAQLTLTLSVDQRLHANGKSESIRNPTSSRSVLLQAKPPPRQVSVGIGKEKGERGASHKRPVIDLTEDTARKHLSTLAPSKTTAAAGTVKPCKRTKASSTAGSSSDPPPVAAIFKAAGANTGPEARRLLQEQAGVQLRAQILQKEQRQRELKLKKQQQRDSAATQSAPIVKPVPCTSVSSPSGQPLHKSKLERATRFPVPSHIFSSETDAASFSTVGWAPDCQWWKSSVSKSKAGQSSNLMPKVQPWSDANSLLSLGTDEVSHSDDDVQLLLSRILIPPQPGALPAPSSEASWADKYYNSGRFISDTSPARRQLHAFVQAWMIERHQAHERRQKKHQQWVRNASKRQLTKKRKKKAIDDDDDWMSGDSDYDGSDDRPAALCLLTGPVGSGKTGLVHAVAEECQCQVLEINTTIKRGAAALKRLVEETTQSFTSLDLLRTSRDFFQPHNESGVQEIVDDSSTVDSDSDDESKQPKQLRTLTLILIDEVDLLYEEDAGFWNTLHSLAKRSKCPIVLTANRAPPEIEAGRHVHFELPRPTAAECIGLIHRIVTCQGLVWALEDEDERHNSLMGLAEICGRDPRRLCHEIQLFSFSQRATNPISTFKALKQTTNLPESPAIPKILSVEPRAVRGESYCTLMIRGTGFLSLASLPGAAEGGLSVVVRVGDQICPHSRILNDATIVAIKAPCCEPKYIVQPLCSLFARRPYSDEYKAVSVSAANPLGLLSTTAGSISELRTPLGKRLVTLDKAVLLKCHFSSLTICATQTEEQHDDATSDEEFVFETASRPRTHLSCADAAAATASLNPIDWPTADRLLQQALAEWNGNSTGPVLATSDNNLRGDSEIDEISLRACLASDAALLLDIGCSGVPFLAGACRGFGFDNTETSSSTETSKAPSEERLFALGWKDDCYFVGDCDWFVATQKSTRDKRLLQLQERQFRGCHDASTTLRQPESVPNATSDDELRPMELSEDQCLLQNLASPCFSSFARCLALSFHRFPGNDPFLRDRDWKSDAALRLQEHLDLLGCLSMVSDASSYGARLFARGLHRDMTEMRPVLPLDETVDPALFRDYLPLLRVMAVLDTAAREVEAASTSAAPFSEVGEVESSQELPTTACRRAAPRRTRNSRRGEDDGGIRRYFLGALLPAHTPHPSRNHDEDFDACHRPGPPSAEALTDRLAEWSLVQARE